MRPPPSPERVRGQLGSPTRSGMTIAAFEQNIRRSETTLGLLAPRDEVRVSGAASAASLSAAKRASQRRASGSIAEGESAASASSSGGATRAGIRSKAREAVRGLERVKVDKEAVDGGGV